MACGNSDSSSGGGGGVTGVGYEEVWRACAGPLLHLPTVGERVFYFPQGHLEQVAASSNWRLSETQPPTFNLPSRILCRVVHIDLRAAETDEVYAQITLLPEIYQADVTKPDPVCPDPPKPIMKSFHKVLTATDTSTKLHVRQQDAHECFPPLDITLENPSQKLVAKDLRGISWNFKHVYGGKPRRHLLSTGWKRFVAAKRLVCGDSVIFLRGENGELRVGTRRVFGQRSYAPHCYLASDKSTDSHAEVLAIADHALCTHTLFTVFYRPSPGISPFIIGLNRSIECATNLCSIGMKFSMRFEREDHLLGRCTGSIVEAGDFSPYWKDSQWRCVKVKWDESATIIRPGRISPWEIEPIDLAKEQISQAKKSRQPRHHRSSREKHIGQVIGEGNMMDLPSCPNEQNLCYQLAVQQPNQPQQLHNMSQLAWASCAQSNMLAMDPLVANQQNWIQNAGQPNWTSLHTVSQICQQSWNVAQSMGPLFSNEDNLFQSMLHQPDQQGSAKGEFGQIFGGAGNGLNTISWGQFPNDSPPIHFSQLDGGLGTKPPSRVSTNSEESVKGDNRKRKTSSVEDAESGNGKEVGSCDDRQVKCRVEPTQCGAASLSNETHYSSASEGDPSTGKCNQISAPVEGTADVSDRPILYRAMDQISRFLHQFKNYVAK